MENTVVEKKIPVIKTDEKTWGGRVYTKDSIKRALDKLRWDSVIPLIGIDRHGNKKEEAYLKKTDLEFDEEKGILYVKIAKDTYPHIYGLKLAPYIHVDYVTRDKEVAYIREFTLNGIQATSDDCAFKSIDSQVKA